MAHAQTFAGPFS